jgi:hypothetical protein
MPDGLLNTPNPDRDLTNALSYTIAYDVSIIMVRSCSRMSYARCRNSRPRRWNEGSPA